MGFVHRHEVLPRQSDPWHERHLRARAAIFGALVGMREAHAAYDDEPLTTTELAGAIRRWIEGQTFAPRTGSTGVRMMDAAAAGFADVDAVRIVGLVEQDWPAASRRSIFYPASLLSQLGWPAEPDRLAAARAQFHDLLHVAAQAVSVSTFTLEDDAIVGPSPFLEELDACGLKVEPVGTLPDGRVFVHEALSQHPVMEHAVGGPAAAWLALRASRSPLGDVAFHGMAGVRPPGVYAVSHVERYLDCPFKYFADHVLHLDEERDVDSGLSPQQRGQFLHEIFEQFFREWHDSGHRAITTRNIADAHALFDRIAEARLARLGDSDRELERTHLLGSAAAAGLAARAFAFEIEQGVEVLERLLEYTLEGEFEFASSAGGRRVNVRAKADRIDLLADGTLRIVDYKLNKAPKPARALQLPVYGVCAEQRLDGYQGRSWKVSRAGYVAFREKNPFVPLGASTSLDEAMATGQQRFLDAVEGIESGAFPPRPAEPFMCSRCGYPSVCRKDYVGDE
jgi:ATP-dependent helicase/nuclease subunit B